jgi:adenylyltransferase/sulfurtransferase
MMFHWKRGFPWIFTGCTGSVGQVMPVFPGDSACLRCLMPSPPPPGSTETCDTAGVLGPAVNVVASFQAALALRILTGHAEQIERRLTIIDVWTSSFRQVDVSTLRENSQCPACQQGERLWLHGTQKSASTILCGRNAVQVTPSQKLTLGLADMAHRLQASGEVTVNPFLVRLKVSESFGVHPVEMDHISGRSSYHSRDRRPSFGENSVFPLHWDLNYGWERTELPWHLRICSADLPVPQKSR